jgi:hypothetical protein
LKKISYIPIKGQVAVLKPIIDKISITYKIADPDLLKALIEGLLQSERHSNLVATTLLQNRLPSR